MRLEALGQVRLVLAAALLHEPVAGDDPALDLVEPDLPAEFDRLAGLVPGDDLRVRLEQRQQLLTSWNRLALDHPPKCLADAPLQPRQELADPGGQACRLRTGLLLEHLPHPFGLGPGALGHLDQPAVGILQRFATLLAFAAGDPVQLLGQLPHGAHPAAERPPKPEAAAPSTVLARRSRRDRT